MKLKLLSERKFIQHPVIGPIFVNPTPEEARRFPNMRGFVDEDGAVWLWNEEGGMHEEVSQQVGEDIVVAFYVRRERKYIALALTSTPLDMVEQASQILNTNGCIGKWGMEIDQYDPIADATNDTGDGIEGWDKLDLSGRDY